MHRQRFRACAYILGILALPAAIATGGRYLPETPNLTSLVPLIQGQERQEQDKTRQIEHTSQPNLEPDLAEKQPSTARRWARAHSH